MRKLIFILAAVVLHAQTIPPTPVMPAPLPNNWAGLYGTWNQSAHPQGGGGFAYATQVSTQAGLYSYSQWDITTAKGTNGRYNLVSTPRTGAGLVRQLAGPFYYCIFGNIGVGTSGQNASFAASAGGMLLWALGKSHTWTVGAGYYMLDTGALGGTTNVPGVIFGRTW